MIHGMVDALQLMRQRCLAGNTVDGWFLVELFRTISRGVPRFRGNYVRKDLPWDAVLHLEYPRPDELHDRLEGGCGGGTAHATSTPERAYASSSVSGALRAYAVGSETTSRAIALAIPAGAAVSRETSGYPARSAAISSGVPSRGPATRRQRAGAPRSYTAAYRRPRRASSVEQTRADPGDDPASATAASVGTAP